MKVALAFIHVVKAYSGDLTAELHECSRRQVASYLEHPPEYDHDFYVVCNGAKPTDADREIFAPLPVKVNFIEYEGNGFDIGGQQYASHLIECDFLISLTVRAYYVRKGWLARFVEARKEYGDGLYGNSGSYEKCPCGDTKFKNPHVRGEFYGCSPHHMRAFPFTVQDKEDSFSFESGRFSFTRYFLNRGLPALWVTWDGAYAPEQWGSVNNGFRRGDQTNLLLRDRHTLIYDQSNEPMRRALTLASWGEEI